MHAPPDNSEIRVERGAEVSPGIFAWHVPVLGLSGRSHQPLLDACRQIKRILGDTGEHAALFREVRTQWDMRCSVEWGAAHTVKEPSDGTIHFAKYRPFPDSAMASPGASGAACAGPRDRRTSGARTST
jgi:hypothetical protein